MPHNDNYPAKPGGSLSSPDAHGPAALLLIESLIHGLCENGTLLTYEAIDIVERAVSVQRDRAEATDGSNAQMWESHVLLASIVSSLRVDEDKP
ncbi:hypothetical protein [Sphingobium sp. Ant17]|uniref:hypothetical protein n=1 Tax=Sphingobium sp. Ant17 TaxID=1461752 RepID=UPI001377923B|nr:hypothetical protein [Sphingobium sp. Ant17]